VRQARYQVDAAAAEREPIVGAGAGDDAARRDRRYALLRFVLANVQMIAAVVAIVLVFHLGLTWPAGVAVLVSFAVSTISRRLRRTPPPPPSL
jgi:hypothetical protein